MKLHFKKLGEGKPLVVLHGLFGTLDNWITAGKLLSENGYEVYLVDQRNHGKSPHSDEFNYDVMAEDLKEFLDDHALSSAIIIGHSMGGKIAMLFSTKHPEMVEKLIIVDIAPKYYPPHHEKIMEAFHAVDVKTVTSRKEAEEQMTPIISNFGVRQFLLKNLDRIDGKSFEWKHNLAVIEKNINEIGQPLKEGQVFDGPSFFIGGAASDYIQKGDRQLILKHFPQAKIASIKGAGHWVHAEKANEFMDVLFAMLNG